MMDYEVVRAKCNEIKEQIKAAVLALGINLDEERDKNGIYISIDVDALRKHGYGVHNDYGNKFYVSIGRYRDKKVFKKNPLPIDEIAAYVKRQFEYEKSRAGAEKKASANRDVNRKLADEIREKHGLSHGVVDYDANGLILKLSALNAEKANKALNLLKVAGIIE